MLPRELSTKTDQSPVVTRQFFSLKNKDVLKFISSLLLPLALGIFTVVITFQQQQAAKQQRDEDRKASQLQRDEDRNASQLQRDLDRYLSDEKYQNELLDTYVKEMGQLLKENNGSLTYNDVTATLARAKTLNIFRQLDPQRNIRIIRFLHEAKQLHVTEKHGALDLATAELPNVDFRTLAINAKQLIGLSLTSIFLSNSTSKGIKMECVDFSRSHLDVASFSFGGLRNISFSHTKLRNVSFSSTQLEYVNFSSAVLENVNLSFILLENIDFDSAILNNTDFTSSLLKNINFRNSSLVNCSFSSSTLFEINFSNAKLKDVTFFSATLRHVDFSRTSFLTTDLSSSRLDFAQFSSAQFEKTNFSFSKLYITEFTSTKLSNVEFVATRLFPASFSKAELQNVTFLLAILGSADFSHTKASETDFRQITCLGADFLGSNLSHSKFMDANVKYTRLIHTDLNNVNFSQANLYSVSLHRSNAVDKQLRSALSIQGSFLPNLTNGHDTNLITNGHADCNSSLVDTWTLQSGNVNIVLYNKSTTDCRFVLQPLTSGATMLQRVSLLDKWNSQSWPRSEVILTASKSSCISILLRANRSTKHSFSIQRLDASQTRTNLLLSDDIQELEVVIEFKPPLNHSNSTSCWCDNINLHIIYGTPLEPTKVPMRASWTDIPLNAQWNKQGQTVTGEHPILMEPRSVFKAEDETIYVTDLMNNRIVAWKEGEINGQVVAGKTEEVDFKLCKPTDVVVDKETDSFLVCDRECHKVVRWPRQNGTRGETIISNISCYALAMDEEGSIYVSVPDENEVRRYRRGESQGTVVAGGNGKGNRLDQLDYPLYLSLDQQHSIFISDTHNHRVMKWEQPAIQGVKVAGGIRGSTLSQLSTPKGVVVDRLGTVYVVDSYNNRVVRWPKGAKQGMLVVGGNGRGKRADQFNFPSGLSFDRFGHLYVADEENYRVQKFTLEMFSN